MKNKSLLHRFGFAVQGIKFAFKNEKSFRTQTVFGSGAIIILAVLRPEPIWWAVFALIVGMVLAVELINTSLEALADRLHPEQHPLIARAKDCGAGAVFILSLCSLVVLIAMIFNEFSKTF